MSNRGDQVSKIINNLLTFSRSRHSEKQLTNMVDVMEHTVDLGKEVISGDDTLSFNQVKLDWQVEKNLPQVACYITEIQQVFLSLFRHSMMALQQRAAKEEFEPSHKDRAGAGLRQFLDQDSAQRRWPEQ